MSIEKAVELMGHEPINEIGQCFESSAAQFIYGRSENPDGTYMCHGIGIANMPGQEGMEIGHAWLEAEIPGGTIAMDTTWGVATQADHYRKLLQLSKVVTYTYDEFLKLWREKKYPGPFDLDIYSVTERKNKNERSKTN